MNRLPDAMISAAAARVRYSGIDVGIGWIGLPLEQSQRAHDHPGLAIAALRGIEFLPRDLNRMAAVRRDSFDRGDFPAGCHASGNAAGADRLTIDVHGARAALSDTAAELRARQTDMIADHP